MVNRTLRSPEHLLKLLSRGLSASDVVRVKQLSVLEHLEAVAGVVEEVKDGALHAGLVSGEEVKRAVLGDTADFALVELGVLLQAAVAEVDGAGGLEGVPALLGLNLEGVSRTGCVLGVGRGEKDAVGTQNYLE